MYVVYQTGKRERRRRAECLVIAGPATIAKLSAI